MIQVMVFTEALRSGFHSCSENAASSVSFFLCGIVTLPTGYSRRDNLTLSPDILLVAYKDPESKNQNNCPTNQYLTLTINTDTNTSKISNNYFPGSFYKVYYEIQI